MAEKFEQLDKKVDQKLTAAEMYLNRPRKWWIYTLIVLILVVLVGWSGSSIHFEGLTVTGREVAKGVISGVTHPDLKLMFGTGDTDVPYLLLQTMAIAVLGTLIGAILAIPFAFLASTNIMPKPIAYLFRVIILHVDPCHRSRRILRCHHPVCMLHRHDLQDVYHRHRGSGHPHS